VLAMADCKAENTDKNPTNNTKALWMGEEKSLGFVTVFEEESEWDNEEARRPGGKKRNISNFKLQI
jgi:hypothetical protein